MRDNPWLNTLLAAVGIALVGLIFALGGSRSMWMVVVAIVATGWCTAGAICWQLREQQHHPLPPEDKKTADGQTIE